MVGLKVGLKVSQNALQTKKNFEYNAPTLSGLMLGLMVGLLPCGHTLKGNQLAFRQRFVSPTGKTLEDQYCQGKTRKRRQMWPGLDVAKVYVSRTFVGKTDLMYISGQPISF